MKHTCLSLCLLLIFVNSSFAQLSSSGAHLELTPHLPPPESDWGTLESVLKDISAAPADTPSESGTVSIKELNHPVGKKGVTLLTKAQKQLNAKDTVAAEQTLRAALEHDDARPYALAMLGSEHLAQFIREPESPKQLLSETIAELRESADTLDGNAPVQSNLALGLLLTGDTGDALKIARRAVQLDPARPRSRYVLGDILRHLGNTKEAVFHLKVAAPHLKLARDLLTRMMIENPSIRP